MFSICWNAIFIADGFLQTPGLSALTRAQRTTPDLSASWSVPSSASPVTASIHSRASRSIFGSNLAAALSASSLSMP